MHFGFVEVSNLRILQNCKQNSTLSLHRGLNGAYPGHPRTGNHLVTIVLARHDAQIAAPLASTQGHNVGFRGGSCDCVEGGWIVSAPVLDAFVLSR